MKFVSSITEILAGLKDIPDETLNMSRWDCHVKGMHSIVLHKDPDTNQLTRMFMTMPYHPLHENLSTVNRFSLGVHNHLYDIELIRLVGNPVNVLHEKCSTGVVTKKYNFESVVTNGRGAKDTNNNGIIRLTGYDEFRTAVLAMDQLHTVYVPKEQRACWIVREGIQHATTNNLYNNAEKLQCTGHDTFVRGPYIHTNAANSVRAFVRRFFDDVRGMY